MHKLGWLKLRYLISIQDNTYNLLDYIFKDNSWYILLLKQILIFEC